MDEKKIQQKLNAILAELLTIQQWAGRYDLKAGPVAGVRNGVDHYVDELLTDPITEVDKEALDDILDDIEHKTLSPGKQSVERRLRENGVSESKFLRYLEVCKHDSRFLEAIEAIAGTRYSHLRSDSPKEPAKPHFLGGMIYFELVDVTGNTSTKGCNAPIVPRVGEIIEPIKGELQEVVDVRHLIISDEFDPNYTTLVPHVFYGPIDDDDDE